jgi:hypothetical protein
MSDEITGPAVDSQATQAPADDATSLRAELAERDRKLAEATGKLSQMEDTLKAFARPPQPIEQAPPGKRGIPPHLRREIAARGMTDAEIEANSPLILPIVEAYLGQAANEVLGIIQGVQDEVAMERMARQVKKFPHMDALYDAIVQIRQQAQQAGRYVDPATAYQIAFANNYERLGAGGEAAALPSASAQTLRSRDAAAGAGLRTMRAAVAQPTTEVRNADDLRAMTREERRRFFEEHANTPFESRR